MAPSTQTRPLAACFALATGEALAFACPEWSPCWPVAAFAAALVTLGGFGHARAHWRPLAIGLMGVVLAFLTMEARNRTLRQGEGSNLPMTLTAQIGDGIETRHNAKGETWHSFPCALGSVRLRVIFKGDDAARPQPGETWRVTGYLQRVDRDDIRHRRNFWVVGPRSSAKRLAPADPDSPRARLAALRRDFSQRVAIGLGHNPTAANLNRAILLGERDRIPNAERETFIAAGTVHIFAISGLHVMVIAHMLTILAVLSFCPVRFAGLVTIPVLWLYVALIGAGPSAVRAAAMASLCQAAPLFLRRPNPLVAWALTFIAVHTLNPEQLLDVGSQLSFTVMLAILLAGEIARPLGRSWRATLVLSIAAWAAGVPIAAHVFGRITPGGLLANLLLIPAATVTVTTGAIGILASYVSTALAAHLNNLAALFTEAMVFLSETVSSIPGANLTLTEWGWKSSCFWYAALALALWRLDAHLRRNRQIL